MITKRIIPCLDVKNGRVVKGVNFEGLNDVSSPVELARYYSENGADELVFYDITASFEGRALFTDILREVASTIFIPLTVGGGINTVEDFDRVLKCGADKVSVNSGAIRNPDLVGEAAKRYGDQCVVLSVDVKRVDGVFRVFAKGGRENTGMEAISWIKRCVDAGAGEVVVNSIDTDGVKKGFDLEMLDAVCNAVSVPVIASGGAGCIDHFTKLFQAIPTIDAGLAASIFHFGEVKISDLKNTLAKEGIPMRIVRLG
ncbi:MAG: imidazole glycerol phosphate synthase subunit HisF [Clostridia bacterium]|nr:imidazole glycerol phosphate synthase subunit HisF [Clostridia bacterium]